MSYVDPTGLFTENYFANRLTPQQQGALGALAIYSGGVLLRTGLGLTSTVGGAGLGALFTAVGAFAIFEGGLNGATALKRLHQNQMDQFDQMTSEGSMLNWNISLPNNNQNRRPSCPVKP